MSEEQKFQKEFDLEKEINKRAFNFDIPTYKDLPNDVKLIDDSPCRIYIDSKGIFYVSGFPTNPFKQQWRGEDK